MAYTAQYTRPYEDGYKDRPDESTPEYAAYVNARDDALLRIEEFLAALNIPTKLSELVNDEGFIKYTVSNLANYYLKTETYARTETYTQSEVQALIADAVAKVSGKLNISIVDALPTSDISTTTFYLVPKETAQEKNVYDEYINTDGTESGWEPIGAVFSNKETLDKFSESEEGKLLWNGAQIEGSGAELPDNIVLSMSEEEEPAELPTCEDLPFKFGIANNEYGYYTIEGDFIPFSSGSREVSIDKDAGLHIDDAYETYTQSVLVGSEEKMLVFSTVYDGNNFGDTATILCGKTSHLFNYDDFGRVVSVIQNLSSVVSYGRYGNYAPSRYYPIYAYDTNGNKVFDITKITEAFGINMDTSLTQLNAETGLNTTNGEYILLVSSTDVSVTGGEVESKEYTCTRTSHYIKLVKATGSSISVSAQSYYARLT